MTPKESAQLEAEKTFDGFIVWTKRTSYAAIAFLLVVASCNFGVEDKPYPGYNGEQYSPSNLKVK
tara:strand:+ start:1382 stop:1576 length:195 start_codon:yes stop_codon:yes gene_type:complete